MIAGVLALALFAAQSPAATITWTAGSGTDYAWDTVGNWSAGIPGSGDDVLFNSPIPGILPNPDQISLVSGDAAKSVTLNANYTLGGGDLTIATGNVAVGASAIATINSEIKGAAGLTKAGTGTLVLGGANSFTGAISVTAGSLSASAANNLGADVAGVLNISNGSIFAATDTFTTDRIVTPGSGGATVSVTASKALTLTSAIAANANALTVSGGGQLILANVNNSARTGALTITGGSTVSANITAGATPVNALGTGAVNLNNGILDLTPTASTGTQGLSGRQFSSNISDTARIDFTQTANSIRTDSSFNMTQSTSPGVPSLAAIQWLGKIQINNGGSYTFQIGSDDGSRLWIDGQLVVQNDGPKGLGNGTSAAINLSSGLHDVRIDYVNSGGNGNMNFNYQGPDQGTMAMVPGSQLFAAETNTTAGASNAVIIGSGIGNDLNVSGISTIKLNGSAFTQVQLGNSTFANGSTLSLATSAGVNGKALRIGGTAAFGTGVTLNLTGDGSNGADLYFDGVLSESAGATTITKTGTGRLVFGQTAAANNLSSGTTLDIQAGTLHLVGTSAAGSFNPIGAAGIQLSGGNLVLDSKIGSAAAATAYNNAITVTQDATIQDIVTGGSLVTLGGPISIAATKTLTLDAIAGGSPTSSLGALLRLNGPISGAGNLAIASSNFGTLNVTPVKGNVQLAGDNSGWTGAVAVPTGLTLSLIHPNAIKNATVNLETGSGLNFQFDGSGTATPETVNFDGTVNFAGDATVTVGRLGTTYAPLFTQAANKTAKLTGAVSLGGSTYTIVNNNGYALELGNTVTLTAAPTLQVNNATSSAPGIQAGLTISGRVTGPSGLNKSGAGTMILANNAVGAGANDFTGTLMVLGGVLGATSDAALGNAGNSINLNGASASFEAFGTFATSRTITFSNATASNNLIQVSSGNTLTLNSVLTGSNGFQKGDPGTLVLNADNLSSGFDGPIIASGGITRVTNAGALGTTVGGTTVANNSGTALQFDAAAAGGTLNLAEPFTLSGTTGVNSGGALQAISGTTTLTGLITLGTAASSIGADLGATLNITGGLSGAQGLNLSGAGNINLSTTGVVTTAPTSLGKNGTGKLTITADFKTGTPLTGVLTFNGGTVEISGAGIFGSTGTNIIGQATTVILDNSGGNIDNRLNTRPTWFGGELKIIGNASSSTTETFGSNFTPSNAGTIVTLVPQSGTSITLGGNWSRSGTSTVLLRGTNLGNAPGAGVATAKFAGGVTIVGQTGAAGTINRGIIPAVIVDQDATKWGQSFAAYDATTNGFQPLASSEYASTLLNAANVRTSSGITAAAGMNLINSLTLDSGGGATIGAGNFIQIDSGGLLAFTGNTGIGSTANGYLVTGGSRELIVHVIDRDGTPGASLQIGSTIAGITGGLTKSGNGTLTLSARNYYTGTTTVNGGKLVLNAGTNTIQPGQALALNYGGALDLNGNVQLVGDLLTNSTGGNETIRFGGNITGLAGSMLVTNQSNTARVLGGSMQGAMTFVRGGQNTLTLVSDNTYTGSTFLIGGTTTLQEAGKLSGTSAITLINASLMMDNNAGLINDNDRVNNAATITLRTGGINFRNRAQTLSSETLGALVLAQGNNEINPNGAVGTGINASELRFASITQSAAAYNGGTGRDATTNFQNGSGQVGSTSRIFFTAPPTVTNNIVPVWIEAGGNEFAYYNPTLGLMALSAQGAPGYTGTTLPTVNDATSASGNYNIGASGVVPVGGLTLNTLNINGAFSVTFQNTASTDVLNLAAGGLIKRGTTGSVIGSVVDEGRLTAGGASPSGTVPLHIMDGVSGTSFTINSRIIDNGASPIRLIINNYNGGAVGLANGNNSYTGGTVVNGWVGNGSGGLSLTGAAGAVVVPAGGLTINNSTVTMVTNAGQINPANTVYMNGNATLTLVGNNTLNSLSFENSGGATNPTVNTGGALSLSAATPIVVTSNNASSVPTINGTLDFGGNAKTLSVGSINLNGTVFAPYNTAANIAAVIQNAGLVTKTGDGNLQLSGQNTFAGGVRVDGGGLVIGANSTPAANGTVVSGPVGTGTLTVANGKALLAGGAFTIGNAVAIEGDLNFFGANNLTLTGAISLPASPTINVENYNMNATLSGTITGAAGGITKTGAGMLTLNAAFAGAVTLPNGGGLSLVSDGDGTGTPNIAASGITGINSSGAVYMNVGRNGNAYLPYYPQAANKTIRISGLNLNGNALSVTTANGYGLENTSPLPLTGNQVLNVVSPSGSNVIQGLTQSGLVSGAFGIIKQGAGTLALTNAGNTFGGASNMIDIQGGVVAVSSDAALGNAGNTINLNAAGTSGVGLRATGTFSTARTINFAQATNGIEVTGGNTLTLTSPFTGTSGTTQLVKNDAGTLELAAANANSWLGSITAPSASAQVLTGGVLVNQGIVRITNAGALGDPSNIIAVNTTQGSQVQIAGGISVLNPLVLNTQASNGYAAGINWSGALRSIGNGVTNTWAGAISENQDAGITADANNTLNLTGGITQNAHIVVFGGEGTINVTTNPITTVHSLDKIGSGTTNIQVSTAAATGNGVRIFAGNLTFSGAGAIAGGGTKPVILNPGGTLNLDNTTTAAGGRLGGSITTFLGGNLNLIGNGGTAVTETIGAPTFNRGQSTITITDNGGGTNLNFTAASNNVNPAQSTGGTMATVLFRGTNLGSPAGAGNATIQWTAGGITFNGQAGAAGTTNKAITPWGIIDTTAGGLGFSFATADTNLSVLRPLAASEYSNGAALVANANALINTTSGSITNQNTISPNSLTFDNSTSITMAAGQTLTLSSGGILVRNGSASSISGGIASQPAANSAWNIHTVGTGSLAISSLINGGNAATAGGLVKAGGGTLTLSTPKLTIGGLTALSANTLNMQTVVNQGTLKLDGGTNTLGANNYLEVGAGGTLDLNGNSQYVQGLYTDGTYNGIANTVTAGGTVTNTSGTQATLVANSDARNWAGQITGNVFFNRSGNATATTVFTQQTYTGGTLISSGTLSLRDYGALTSTSGIDLNYAALTMDNTGSAGIADRIADTIPITMRGGTLTFSGRAQTDSTETLGTVSLAQGLNVINVTAGGTGINSAVLTADLSRPAGSAATVILGPVNGGVSQNGQMGSAPRMLLTTPPSLSNNLIGPWAIISREWASYIPGLGVGQLNANGFAGYASNALTGAPLATDNIRIANTNTTMTADQTVNTVNLQYNGNQSIDLGGKTLTLAGGGLILATGTDNVTGSVNNGTLTAGALNVGGDLYVHFLPYSNSGTARFGSIGAVIADNGTGPLRLVLTSDPNNAANRMILAGANTYTGGTVLNAGSHGVSATGVIPAGGITLNGAALFQAVAGQLTPGTINSANVVTLNGPSSLNLSNDNTLAGLVFNNTGGTAAPTVNTFVGGSGIAGDGTLTIGTSGIVANSSNVQTTAIIQGRIDTGATGNTLTINPISVNGASVAPLSPTLAIQGWLGSAGTITKAGAGVLQLNAQQVFTGTLDVTAGGVGFGTLGNTGLAAGNAAGSRYARINLGANTFLNLTNTDATIGSLSGSGTVFNQAPTGAAATGRTFNLGFDGTDSTFSGSFARFTDVLPGSFQVNKIGAGTMTLTGVSNTTLNLQVSQGGVTFSGNGAASFANYLVAPTGTLTLDNSGTNIVNRLGGATNAGSLQVSGGTFRMIGNAAVPTSETIGTLTFNGTTNPGGPGTITLLANPAQPLTLTVGTAFTAITAGAYDSGLIRGVSATAGNGLANLSIGTIGLGAPTGAGTGVNGTTAMPIRPDLLGDASPTGVGTGFITKDSATNFLRPLTAAELAPTSAVLSGAGTTTVNYGLSSATSIGAGGQFGSITLNSGGALQTITASGTADGLPINPQVVSGGILAFSGNAGINVGRMQTANNFAFNIHTLGNLTINGVLNGTTGGLVKSDAGTLTLNSKALFTGQVNVNGGTLVLNGGDNTLPVLVTGGAPTALSTGVHSGALDLNGNNQIIGSLFSNGLARYANNAGVFTNTSLATATLTSNLGSAQVVGGAITGNLNFTKGGNFALTLTSNNTYTGVTTVRNNTLVLLDSGTLANTSAVNINYSGLTLDNTGLNPVGNPNLSRIPAATPITLRVGTLTYTPGQSYDYAQSLGTVNVSQGHNTISVTQAPISSTGALTINNLVLDPDATLNVTGGNSSGFFSVVPGMNISNLFINQINGVAIPANITGKILGGNILTNNGEFTTYVQPGTTGGNGQNWGIVTMNGTAAGAQATYDATTIAVGVNPNTTVRISGTGTQTIGAGGATVNAVAVRAALTNLNFTNATDVLNLNSGGLALTNGGTTVSASANAGVITAGGTPAVSGTTARLYIHSTGTNAVNSTLADNVAGSGNNVRFVANVPSGTLTIGGANTYTGGTVVNGGGTLALSATGTIPAGGVTINGTTLTATTAQNQINSANDVTLNGGGVLTLGNFANTLNSLTFNDVGGNGTPTVTAGAAGLTLSSANPITATNDNTSTVPVVAGGSLALSNGSPVITASTTALTPTDLSITAPIHSTGGAITKSGSGSLVLAPAFAVASGVTTVGSNIVTFGSTTGITVGQVITGTGIPANEFVTSILSATQVQITTGTGVTAGTNTMTFSGSTFNAGLNLTAGTLILGNSSNVSAGTLLSGPIGTGTLTMADGTALISDSAVRTIANPVALQGNITFGSTSGIANASAIGVNGVTLSGLVDLGSATRTINVNSFQNTSTISGAISGASGAGLTKTGPGTLVLTGANSFDGPVTINGGVLQTNATGIGSVGTITFGGGILQYAASTTTDFSGRFATANNQPIYIDTGANTVTYATALTSATGGSLGKFGAGTLILNAAATYDGNTIINAGTLQVGAGTTAGSIPATTNIYDSGTLYINRGAVTTTHNGAITGSGGLTLDAGTFTPTGTVNLGGALQFGNANGTATAATLDLSASGASFGGALNVRTNNATANSIILPTGRTLSIAGGISMGYDAGSGTGATLSRLTVSGGGSMSVTGATITIGTNQAATNALYWNDSTLDVTGLSSFSANVTTFNVGVGTTTQGPGTLLLSDTANTIVATTLTAGNTGGNNGRGTGRIQLGAGTNVIQVDTFNIGLGKSTGPGLVEFLNKTAGSPGTVTITDKAGTGAANITVGDSNGVATAGGAVGTLDLRGHIANIAANTLLIGRNNMGSTGAGGVTGTVNFDGGTFTVNTLNMAARSAGGTGAANATLNVSGGAFNVNTAFTLGSQATAGTSVGTLNLTGGLFTSNVDILDGGGAATTTITLNGGALDLTGKKIGSATASIDNVTLQSGTLMNVAEINNGAAITKTTTGTLILDGTNTWTGTTTAADGTLLATRAVALPGYNVAGKVTAQTPATLAVRAGAAGQWVTSEIDTLVGATGAAFNPGSTFGVEVLSPNTFTYPNDLAGAVAAKGFTKLGAGTLVTSASQTYTGPTTVAAGNLTARGNLASAVTVNNGATFEAGPTTGTVATPASVSVNSLAIGTGATDAATARITSAVTGGTVLVAPTLSMTGSGSQLNVDRNGLVLNYDGSIPGEAALRNGQVRQWIKDARNTGNWDGPTGITSKLITPVTAADFAVGYRDSSAISPTGGTFMGQAVDGDSVLVRYTMLGDSNLDGVVNFIDLVAVAQNYNTVGTGEWNIGDFNYDNDVNFIDLVAVAQHYNQGLPSSSSIPGASAQFQADWNNALAIVPEPGTLSLLALGSLLLMRRGARRRAA